jgi:conjugal transfer/entry exclusion protein
MKKMIVMTGIVMMGTLTPVQKAEAQNPILEVIKAAVIKVIKAVDLKIQRLQNETIMLQNAQKALENTLTKLKLDNITEWVEKHRNLYKDYYEELYKVKNIITYYKRIKDISEKQVKIMEEYKWAWNLFKKDENFTADELEYMAKVYSGLLDQSVKNIDQISLVVNSFVTQMSDAKRLQIINSTADQVDANYYDLTKFNQEAILLSLQRSKAQKDLKEAKKIYGIN